MHRGAVALELVRAVLTGLQQPYRGEKERERLKEKRRLRGSGVVINGLKFSATFLTHFKGKRNLGTGFYQEII